MSQFFQFIDSLVNIEKTRNFKNWNEYKLDTFQEVWEYFNLHQNELNYKPIRVSIVGTNGKGSLAHYLTKIGLLLDLFTGTYTSPHFLSPLERIQINGKNISEEFLNAFFQKLTPDKIEKLQKLSYFEAFTLFCALSFKELKTQLEIIEAGLGGRLDATKLFSSEYIALTKIGLDHMEILGDTKLKILKEKLGISTSKTKKIYALKPNKKKDKNLIHYIEEFSQSQSIPLLWIEEENYQDKIYLDIYKDMAYLILKDIFPNHPKIHTIPWNDTVHPPGRLEKILDNPLWIYDTAHNPQAMENTIQDIKKVYGKKNWSLVFGCLPDKDIIGIYEKIHKSTIPFQNIIFLSFPPFLNWTKESENVKVLKNKDEFFSYLMNCKVNQKKLIFMGSFRIYPLLHSFLSSQ